MIKSTRLFKGGSFTGVCDSPWCRGIKIGSWKGRLISKIDKVPQGRGYQTVQKPNHMQWLQGVHNKNAQEYQYLYFTLYFIISFGLATELTEPTLPMESR